jgi:hypothetical protein
VKQTDAVVGGAGLVYTGDEDRFVGLDTQLRDERASGEKEEDT